YSCPPMSHSRLLFTLLISALCAATSVAQNTSPAKTKQPVATVNGQPIYEEDLAPAIEGQMATLRNQEYEIKRKALDGVIDQKLLDAAAKKKGITTEQLLNQEVNSKVPDPSDDEVAGYYFALRDRIKSPLANVKGALRESLKDAKSRQLREDYL